MLFHQPLNSRGNYNFNQRVYQNVDFKPHFHKNFEVICVLAGRIRVEVGDSSAVLTPGQYAMILSHQIHSLTTDGPSKCWVGVFSGDFVRTFEAQTRGKEGSGFVFTCGASVERFLWEQLIQRPTPPLLQLKACLYALCSEYCSRVELKSLAEKSGQFMRAVTDYIAENYRSKVSLSDLAGQLGYNYHYLSKCFHKNFGMSFTDFLNSYRLDAALALLTETDRDITEIALESGFQSIRSFNEYFKAHVGTTPARYRSGAAQRE